MKDQYESHYVKACDDTKKAHGRFNQSPTEWKMEGKLSFILTVCPICPRSESHINTDDQTESGLKSEGLSV